MALDPFNDVADSITAPASAAVPIVPDDATPLATTPRAIYVGSGGDVTMRGKRDGVPRLWRNVPSGAVLPFRAALVCATGTTAADLLALY